MIPIAPALLLSHGRATAGRATLAAPIAASTTLLARGAARAAR